MNGPTRNGAPGVIGVVLAGGLARRLGGAKADLPLAGRPLIAYALEAFSAAGLDAVVIAKADTPLPELGVPIWVEKPAHRHPAYGIASALARARRPVVVSACDTPFLPPRLLSLLAELDRPLVSLETKRGLEPLPGRYAPSLGGPLAAAASRGEALHLAVSRLRPHRIAEPELRRYGDPRTLLMNVNTQDDVERAESILAQAPEP